MKNPAFNVIIISMVTYDAKDKFAAERNAMVHRDLAGRDITSPAVLEIMAQIPREEFLPEKYLPQAYADRPLPIGLGQTISQPYIVALMTQHLDLKDTDNVLEIGTGSGYQTAILAHLAKKVYTIERFNQLSESAQTILSRLDINNVEYYIGDGSCGWPENKSFDKIIITAAVPEIPLPLIDQLKDNGTIVAPIGGEFSQELIICKKIENELTYQNVCPCRFVKLIGKYGFSRNQ